MYYDKLYFFIFSFLYACLHVEIKNLKITNPPLLFQILFTVYLYSLFTANQIILFN